jgi:hypothetical protein
MGVLPSPSSISLPYLSHPPFHITIHTTIISKYLSLRSLIHVTYCFGHWRYAINSIYPSMFLAFFLLFSPPYRMSASPSTPGRETTSILKFLDLMFFNLDLLISGGFTTIRSTPSDSRLSPLQSTISRLVVWFQLVGACTPRARSR